MHKNCPKWNTNTSKHKLINIPFTLSYKTILGKINNVWKSKHRLKLNFIKIKSTLGIKPTKRPSGHSDSKINSIIKNSNTIQPIISHLNPNSTATKIISNPNPQLPSITSSRKLPPISISTKTFTIFSHLPHKINSARLYNKTNSISNKPINQVSSKAPTLTLQL